MHYLIIISSLFLYSCSQSHYEKSEYQSALQTVFNKNNQLVQQINTAQKRQAKQQLKTQKQYLLLVEASEKITAYTTLCLQFIQTLKQPNNLDEITINSLKDSLIQFKQTVKSIVKEIAQQTIPGVKITSGVQDSLALWIDNHLPTDTILYPIHKNMYWQSIENQINMVENIANDFLFDRMGNMNIHSFWATSIVALMPSQIVRKGELFEAMIGINYGVPYGQFTVTIDGKKMISNYNNVSYSVIPKRLGKHFYTVYLEVENLITQELDTVSRTFYYYVTP